MKNIKIAFIVITVIIMIFLGVFYFTVYSNFTETTLVSVEIEHIEDTQSLDQPENERHSEEYLLSKEEKNLLLKSLQLNTENVVENRKIFSLEEINIPEKQKIVPFSMRLVNRFNQVKEYNIYLKSQNTAYVEVEDTIYEIEGHEFYYTHPGFDPYYKVKYLPGIEIENEVLIDQAYATYNWKIQRYDGSWVERDQNKAKDHSVENEKSSLLLESEKDFLELYYSEAPDKMSYSILDSETKEEVYEGVLDEMQSDILPTPEINGKYSYLLSGRWENGTPRSITISFDIEISRPIIFTVDKTTMFQDEIIEITASRTTTAKDIETEGFLVEDLQWYKKDQQLRTVIATNYHTDPGIHTIELKDLNKDIVHSYDIEVLPRDYKTQYLSIDTSIEERTRNQEAYAEMEQYYDPVRKISSEEKHYDNEFILPTEGRLTTEFGERRYVNNELTSYRHNGIDIAAPLGTEVLATNHGEVVFEREMILMGNTIVIDHGHGLFSSYLHLSEIDITKGEWVEKGDVIGSVGTTGFSTGPHLHFTLSYYETPLEPGYFIIGKPYTKEEHYQIRR